MPFLQFRPVFARRELIPSDDKLILRCPAANWKISFKLPLFICAADSPYRAAAKFNSYATSARIKLCPVFWPSVQLVRPGHVKYFVSISWVCHLLVCGYTDLFQLWPGLQLAEKFLQKTKQTKRTFSYTNLITNKIECNFVTCKKFLLGMACNVRMKLKTR